MNDKETKLVRKMYKKDANYEWRRLSKDPSHRLEFETTLSFLKKNLPRHGLILDAGGGPGRYTIELAKLGYDLVLLDLVPEHLELAKRQIQKAKVDQKVKKIIEGSITDLSEFQDGSFDAVICLGGPLSHVYPESERRKAVKELVRVAKRKAPVFISVMSRYGTLLATPGGWPDEVKYKKEYEKFAFAGDDYRWHKNSFSHFFTLDEFEKLLTREPIKILHRVGLEGLNCDTKTTNAFVRKFPKAWKNWQEINQRMCTDPFVVDASKHMMIVARKK